MTIQSITKSDAATRQLRQAIRLYFHESEPLAVHTIAGAAHGLLRDLLRRTKGNLSGCISAGMVKSAQEVSTIAARAEQQRLSVAAFLREIVGDAGPATPRNSNRMNAFAIGGRRIKLANVPEKKSAHADPVALAGTPGVVSPRVDGKPGFPPANRFFLWSALR